MPTNIKAGIYQPPLTSLDEDTTDMIVYVDEKIIQLLDNEEKFICQLTYEELRGIMGIIAAEQEKAFIRIQAQIKKN
jgi:hypothetical protein